MTPPIVFVRHGETDWNVAGRLQGQTDIALNPRGRDQAASVGRTLRKHDLSSHAYLASPLSRAAETMRLMRGAMGLDVETFGFDDRLKEMGFGRWEGLTFPEVRERDPNGMAAREADRWSFRPPDGESYDDVTARLSALIAGLDRPMVLVSHGGVARALLALVAGGDRAKLAEMRIQQGRAIFVENGAWRWS